MLMHDIRKRMNQYPQHRVIDAPPASALVGSDLKCDPAQGFVLQIRKGAPGETGREPTETPATLRTPRPDRLNPTRPTARTRVEHLGQHGAGRYSDLEDPTHPRLARHVFMLSVYVHC